MTTKALVRKNFLTLNQIINQTLNPKTTESAAASSAYGTRNYKNSYHFSIASGTLHKTIKKRTTKVTKNTASMTKGNQFTQPSKPKTVQTKSNLELTTDASPPESRCQKGTIFR